MIFYKIPLDADLSQTSYRASVATETNIFIEYNEGHVEPSWVELTEEELLAQFEGVNPFEEKPIPEPYQPSNAEVAQMISDLQADLIIAGVL